MQSIGLSALHLPVKHTARPGGPHHVAETPSCHLLPQRCLTLWVLRSSALRNQGSLMYILRCLGSFWQKMPRYERAYADALQKYKILYSAPRFAAWNGFAGIRRYLVLSEKAAWDIWEIIYRTAATQSRKSYDITTYREERCPLAIFMRRCLNP